MSSANPTIDSLDGSRGLRFAKLEYTSELRMPLHSHDDAASLDFCLDGTLEVFRDRNAFVLGPSSLSLMPRGVPHANCFPESVRTFLVVMKSEWLERFSQMTPFLCSPRCCSSGRPTWIAARMYREFQRRDDLTVLSLEGMLLELLAEMARDAESFVENKLPPWLGLAMDYLRAHLTQPLSTEMIASAIGVHPAHLMRTFRRHHKTTIGEYVRRLRVEYACHLLSASCDSLGQIALDAGFSDQSHFSRTFKKQMGMSPREFQSETSPASSRQKMHF